ncbi:MAG: hemin uptake protein HemP [Rhodobacteraceae bacterium]|nr:MAG: hemin uptake protein HemP [Paracoccaceae bacterium]
MRDDTQPLKPLGRCPAHASNSVPLHRAQSLTQEGSTAHIDLDGQIYTLRITRAGKLILTK